MTRPFVVALVFTVPVFVLAMSKTTIAATRTRAFVELALATPVCT